MIPAARAVNVGIILNELVTNAIRHGFPDGRAGAISIVGKASDSTVRLAVRDNGVGLRSGFDPSAGSGLGMRLTMSLADQFGSALAWSDDQGSTVFSFEIPLH
jgi:two-component sensor histidine kinase